MQRFYFRDLIPTASLTIRDEGFVHQISRVLRGAPGDTVILFSWDGEEYVYTIEVITKKDITLSLVRSEPNTLDPKRRIGLYQALPNKYEKIEWVIEKGVEVGISSFTFFPSERSQKLAITDKKIARWYEIAREALEQSGGNRFPEITFLDRRELPEHSEDRAFALHTDTKQKTHHQNGSDSSAALFVGPEGGWSDAEIATFDARGIEILRFDGRIMRTETAGPVVAFSLLHT